MVEIGREQARNLQLSAQGLLHPAARAATAASLRACIRRMALLQIDTIHVVARSPYLVLFSRLGAYPTHWLERALERGEVFETWAHEACFSQTQDLALHRSYNRGARRHWGLASGRAGQVRQAGQLRELLRHIDANGPVKSSDFERPAGQRGGGWWDWKDEKVWLEALFANGDLMVSRRDNFHRVYDMAQRVCPQLDGTELPDAAQVHAKFTERAVAALGVTQARWVHDYFRTKPRCKDADLDGLVNSGRVQQVRVEGWSAPGYVHRSHQRALRLAQRGQLEATHTTVLSPFDPLVWDRERASEMFDLITASSVTPRKQNGCSATSCCRCCTVAGCWHAWTPRHTANRRCSK